MALGRTELPKTKEEISRPLKVLQTVILPPKIALQKWYEQDPRKAVEFFCLAGLLFLTAIIEIFTVLPLAWYLVLAVLAILYFGWHPGDWLGLKKRKKKIQAR